MLQEEEKGRIIIDEETGEITDRLRPGDRNKVTRRESIEYLNQFQEWKIEQFYKGHIDEIRSLIKDLSINEKAFLFSVALYVGYEDCCLKYPNGQDLTTDDLVNITGLCRSVLFATIKDLIKKDVLYRGKNSKNRQYFVNPWIFCKGNRINKVLKTMFKNYRVRVHGGTAWKNLKDIELG